MLRPIGLGRLYLFRHATGYASPASVLEEDPALMGGDQFANEYEGADLNGDGLADLMVNSVTSTMETSAPYNLGRMYVYLGGRDGLLPIPIWFDRVRPTDPMDDPPFFAGDITSPGDLNGDGIDDAVILDQNRGTWCYVMGSATLVGAHLAGCNPMPGRGLWLY